MKFSRSLVSEVNVARLPGKERNDFFAVRACKELIMRAKSAEDAFATRGFQNWKLIATTVFRQHELGAFHEEAVERVIALPKATTDIGVYI